MNKPNRHFEDYIEYHSERFKEECCFSDCSCGNRGNSDEFMREIIYRTGINIGCGQIQIERTCKYSMAYSLTARRDFGRVKEHLSFSREDLFIEFLCSMDLVNFKFGIGYALREGKLSKKEINDAIDKAVSQLETFTTPVKPK